MTNLSSHQEAVVHAEIGKAMQVLAAAGSGKTRVLTERVRHLVSSTRKDGVIALTFTNKAAEEMQARLADLEEVNERCWVATIHGVAQRILEKYGHTIGLPTELHIYEREQDRKAVFLQSLRDNNINFDEILNSNSNFSDKDREKAVLNYLNQFSIVKRELLSEDEIKAEYESDASFWQVFKGYQEALIQSGGIDFDDILVYAHRILMEQEWCGDIYRAKYKHLCIDEAQDLNKAQYEFIKALCGTKIVSVMMVGDPNQMIYGFNGSSSEYLCVHFVRDFSALVFELKENYRSSKAVIRLANALKPGSQIEADFVLDGISQISGVPDEQAEADWISNKIKLLLSEKENPEIEGPIQFSKMVVIARNRFVFQKLEEVLSKQRIPYSLKKGERAAEPTSSFGKVLDLSVRVRLNPKDWIDGKKLCTALKVPTLPSWGGDGVLLELAQAVLSGSTTGAEIYAELLTAIHALDAEKPNIPKLCDQFDLKITELGTRLTSISENEIELSLQELRDFRTSWTTFRRKGLGESLGAFRNAIALGQVSEDFDPSVLTLSTVHTMKGLEKDIVFLMGMCEGVFPDYRATTKKELDEELNSAFVAVTRAKRWIFVSYPAARLMPWGSVRAQQPSRFIRAMQSSA